MKEARRERVAHEGELGHLALERRMEAVDGAVSTSIFTSRW